MYLALTLKYLRYTVLFIIFSLLLTSLAFSQKKSSIITEAEARAFMEEFLAFSSFGFQVFDEPEEELLNFLPPELQKIPVQKMAFNFEIGAARIQEIRLPWVDVLVKSPYGGPHFWDRKCSYYLEKEKGRLYIDPEIEHEWRKSIISCWKKQEFLENDTPYNNLDRIKQKNKVLAYLEKKLPDEAKEHIPEAEIYGDWIQEKEVSVYRSERYPNYGFGAYGRDRLDTTYWIFEEDGAFWMDNTAGYGFSSYEEPKKEWWLLWNNRILIGRSNKLNIYKIKKWSPGELQLEILEFLRRRTTIYFKARRNWETRHPLPTELSLLDHPGLEVVQEPRFDRFRLGRSLSIVEREGKKGLLSAEGELFLEPIYRDLYVRGKGRKVYAPKRKALV